MCKLNFKLFLALFLGLFFCHNLVLGQILTSSKQIICKCQIKKDTYYFSQIEQDKKNLYRCLDIDYIKEYCKKQDQESFHDRFHKDGQIYDECIKNQFENAQRYLNNLEEYFSKGLYYVDNEREKIETNIGNDIMGVPATWILDDCGISGGGIIIKKPFDTYNNESKNFDVMFGLKRITVGFSSLSPFFVVKNYFQAHEYKSIRAIYFIIGDERIEITEKYDGFGNIYSEKELALKSGISIIAYRTVTILRFPLNDILSNHTSEDREAYLNNLIKKATPGKVSIVYETMTGQIKRVFTDSQISSFKEMIKIYSYLLKNEIHSSQGLEYKNETVQQECKNLENQIPMYMNLYKTEIDTLVNYLESKKILYNEDIKSNYEKMKEETINNITVSLYNRFHNQITKYPIKTRKNSKTKEDEPIPELFIFHESYKESKNHKILQDFETKLINEETKKIFNDEQLKSIYQLVTDIYFSELENKFNAMYKKGAISEMKNIIGNIMYGDYSSLVSDY
jgi:hypothetical protein